MSLFFKIESLCTKCGKFIEMIADGPYFNSRGEFTFRDNKLSNGFPLSLMDKAICDECKKKKEEEEEEEG